jgi:hypothetical protein
MQGCCPGVAPMPISCGQFVQNSNRFSDLINRRHVVQPQLLAFDRAH